MPEASTRTSPTAREYIRHLETPGCKAVLDVDEWGYFWHVVSPDGRNSASLRGDDADVNVPQAIINLTDGRLGVVSQWNEDPKA